VIDRLSQVGSQFVENLDQLPGYLSQHVLITVVALAIGVALSLPLAVWATRHAKVRVPLLTFASVNQTIPSIALLALVYAVIGGFLLTGVSIALWGVEVRPAFIAAVVALTLYSMLPVLRNTVTGIEEVDPALTEAARGMGMTPGQVLRKVELPLAMPVIIAGVRTATVWVVGIATLSTPVGQPSLGNFIFTGLQLENWGMVLLGCVAAAVLAIVLDLLIAQLQVATQQRSKARGLLAGAGLAAVIVLSLLPLLPDPPAEGDPPADAPQVRVGAKTFDEQFILASVIRDRLREAGFDASKRENLGSTLAFRQLVDGRIDAYVDYTGTIWAVQMERTDPADPETVYREMESWLEAEHGIETVGRLGFENAYCIAMRRDQAERLGIRTIADLARHAPGLTIGGDYEFFERPEWEKVSQAYGGLNFKETRTFQSTLMYQAVKNGDVDVIVAFSSDGRIAAYDLLVLEDPRDGLPPYDAVLLVAEGAAALPGFVESLRPLVGAISDPMMRRANYMVDRQDDKKTPDEAAAWLEQQIAEAAGPPDGSD